MSDINTYDPIQILKIIIDSPSYDPERYEKDSAKEFVKKTNARIVEMKEQWSQLVEKAKADGKDPVEIAWESSKSAYFMTELASQLGVVSREYGGNKMQPSEAIKLKIDQNHVLVCEFNELGSSSPTINVFEVDKDGKRTGKFENKEEEYFVQVLKEQTEGKITTEVVNKYLDKVNKPHFL